MALSQDWMGPCWRIYWFLFKAKARRGWKCKISGIKRNASPFVGTSTGSVKKSELGQSCSEDKWVCRQNGSSSAGGVLVWRRRRGKSLEICSERHGGSRLTVETQTQRPVDCGAPRTTLLPAPPPQPTQTLAQTLPSWWEDNLVPGWSRGQACWPPRYVVGDRRRHCCERRALLLLHRLMLAGLPSVSVCVCVAVFHQPAFTSSHDSHHGTTTTTNKTTQPTMVPHYNQQDHTKYTLAAVF